MPGLDGTGELFHELLRSCPPNLTPRVITYPRNEVQDSGEIVRQSLSTFGQDSRSLLIAESFSGPYAVRAAQEMGSRLLGIVLCNSFVTSPIPAILRLAPLSLFFRLPIPRWAIRHYLVGARASEDLVSRVGNTVRTVDPAILAGRVRTVMAADVRAELRACEVPILYIRGTEDRLVPERSVAEILRLQPKVVVRRIEGPHFLLQAAAAQAWAAVQEFIRRVA